MAESPPHAAFPRPGARAFALAGPWRWFPWFPLMVMAAVTLFATWLAANAGMVWLGALVVSPALVVALVIARDTAGMTLWIDEAGLSYRGAGYTVDAPWPRISAGRDSYGRTARLDDPAVSTSGWFGLLFAFSRRGAPLHGHLAAFWMRSVPLYCFGGDRVVAAIRQSPPPDIARLFA